MMAFIKRLLGTDEVTKDKALEREERFKAVESGLDEAKQRVRFLELEAELRARHYPQIPRNR